MGLAPPHYNVLVNRFLRILRAVATLVSLFLFITILILWPCSYYVADGISQGRNGYSDEDGSLIRRIRGLRSSRGVLEITSGHFSSILFPSISPSSEGIHVSHEASPTATNPQLIVWSHLGFSEVRYQTAIIDLKVLAIPYWFPGLLLSILPILWFRKFLRQRRRLASPLCTTCGYDMRATPDRCPECGTPAVTMPS